MRASRTWSVAALLLALVVAVVVLHAGRGLRPASDVSGSYAVAPTSACLGSRLTLQQSGRYVDLSGDLKGALTLHGEHLTGGVHCRDGAHAALGARIVSGRLTGTIGGARLAATHTTTAPVAPAAAPAGSNVFAVLRAIAIVTAFCALAGAAVARLRQPRVIGEALAGILLGPTLLGAVAPSLEAQLFPAGALSALSAFASLGLALFAFLMGIEIDLAALRSRLPQTLAVASAGIGVPFAAGMGCALATFTLVGPPTRFAGYAVFLGAAMAITAFPVLARILVERGMLSSPIGTLALGCAALNDAVAWVLVAVATGLVHHGSGSGGLKTLGLVLAFAAVVVALVRPLLRRLNGSLPWAPAVALALALGGAAATQRIGVSVLLGGFLLGACMPRRAMLTARVEADLRSHTAFLLPLFFAMTGLQTDVRLLGRPALLALTVGLTIVAIAAKGGATLLAGRGTCMSWRDASTLGLLMNARGLTELVVLSVGLTAGAISPALYAALVVMAFVTTLATAPLLGLVERTRAASGQSLPQPLPEAT